MSTSVAELSLLIVAAGAVLSPPPTIGIDIVEGEGVLPGALAAPALMVEVGDSIGAAVTLAVTTVAFAMAVAVAVDVAVLGVELIVTAVVAKGVAVAVGNGTGVTVDPPGSVAGTNVLVGPGFGGLGVLVGGTCVGDLAGGTCVEGGVVGLAVGQGTLKGMHSVACKSGCSIYEAQATGPARLDNTTSVTSSRLPHKAQELMRMTSLQSISSRF